VLTLEHGISVSILQSNPGAVHSFVKLSSVDLCLSTEFALHQLGFAIVISEILIFWTPGLITIAYNKYRMKIMCTNTALLTIK